MKRYEKIDKAYDFLISHAEFDPIELQEASGWTEKNTKTNLSKKLKGFLDKGEHKKYKLLPTILSYNKNDFRKIFSQTYTVKISTKTERLLKKSKECVLTAVQNYNNPLLDFRLGSFITLSFIGFSSLFHAVFERDQTVEYKKEKDFLKLIEALDQYKNLPQYNKQYEKGYLKKEVKKNIECLRDIRNKIEHAYCELSDIDLYPLCQKLLYDYQKILIKEFGREHNIGNKLCLALQFSYQYDYSKIQQNKAYKELRERIFQHISSTKIGYPMMLPLMIPAEQYKNIDLTKIDPSKYSQIIAIIQERKRYNAKKTAEILNDFMVNELQFTKIKFDSIKLLSLTRKMGWRGEGSQILNDVYLGYDELKKGNIYYKEEALTAIKEELHKDFRTLFQKILSDNQFKKFFGA